MSCSRRSGFTESCPLLAAGTQDQAPEARRAAGHAFETWRDLLAAAIQRAGAPPDRARSLAVLTVAAVEGAIAMARAQHSCAPLDDVEAELLILLQPAVARDPS